MNKNTITYACFLGVLLFFVLWISRPFQKAKLSDEAFSRSIKMLKNSNSTSNDKPVYYGFDENSARLDSSDDATYLKGQQIFEVNSKKLERKHIHNAKTSYLTQNDCQYKIEFSVEDQKFILHSNYNKYSSGDFYFNDTENCYVLSGADMSVEEAFYRSTLECHGDFYYYGATKPITNWDGIPLAETIFEVWKFKSLSDK